MEDKIKSIIVEELGVRPEEVTPEKRLVEDLGADSLNQTAIVIALEDVFDLDIPDEEAVKLLTFGDIVEYVRKKNVGG